MKREPNTQEPSGTPARRVFLRKLAFSSAAVGVAAATGPVAAATQPEAAPAAAEPQGYRETGHVRAYYATCR